MTQRIALLRDASPRMRVPSSPTTSTHHIWASGSILFSVGDPKLKLLVNIPDDASKLSEFVPQESLASLRLLCHAYILRVSALWTPTA